MSVRDEIVRLVAPPDLEIPAADWEAAEAYLGTDLPSGYKWLVGTYGGGVWGAEGFGRMAFRHPNHVGDSLLDLMKRKRDALLSRREHCGDRLHGGVSYPIFPEAKGLVAFASSPDDSEFYFLVDRSQEPDAWTVVWHDFAVYDELRWSEFSGGFESFMRDLVRGDLPEAVTGAESGYTEFEPLATVVSRPSEHRSAEG